MSALRIGSRGSALALWQARHMGAELERLHGVAWDVVIIKTSGDQFAGTSVAHLGLKGVFIKELEDALLSGAVDLAVHSMKDVPTVTPEGLVFPAITRREDCRDCVVSRSGAALDALPAGARVGTSSLRRRAQLLRRRPDLGVAELRGNVDTRLRKLDAGEYDAIVLARAGLQRLGLAHRITEALPVSVSLPAVGQGALGVECRAGDTELRQRLAALDDRDTRDAVTAERALLGELEGGCQLPLGAWGRLEGEELVLDARVLSADGRECVEAQERGPREDAVGVGIRLAQRLRDAGAGRILAGVAAARAGGMGSGEQRGSR